MILAGFRAMELISTRLEYKAAKIARMMINKVILNKYQIGI